MSLVELMVIGIAIAGLMLAAGCIVITYSRSFYAAATSVAIASVIKSWRVNSMWFDAAAVPCALYAGIAPVAMYYMLGGKGKWPGVTLDVSYQLLKGQARMPLQAWSMAQNAGAVNLMASTVSKWA